MRKGIISQLSTEETVGFIKTDLGEHFFFNGNDLQGVAFCSLKIGQEIKFEIGKGWRGRARAINIRILKTKEAKLTRPSL